MSTDSIRVGAFVAFADTFDATALISVDVTDDRWTEPCEGCDGTGHLGRRVEPASGPCEHCWGTGRAFFAFDTEDRLCAVNVPVAVVVANAPEFLTGLPWTREA